MNVIIIKDKTETLSLVKYQLKHHQDSVISSLLNRKDENRGQKDCGNLIWLERVLLKISCKTSFNEYFFSTNKI